MKKIYLLIPIILISLVGASSGFFDNLTMQTPETIVSSSTGTINISFDSSYDMIPFFINISIIPVDGTPQVWMNDFMIPECEEKNNGTFLCSEILASGFNFFSYNLMTKINLHPGNYLIEAQLGVIEVVKTEYISSGGGVRTRTVNVPVYIQNTTNITIIKEVLVEKIVDKTVYVNQTIEVPVEIPVKQINWFWVVVFSIVGFIVGIILMRILSRS